MPGVWRPYFLIVYKSVTASTTDTLTASIGMTEEFQGEKLITNSTSTYDVQAITDESGKPYTNATSSASIDNLLIDNVSTNAIGQIDFPIYMAPGGKINIKVLETSGSDNEIWWLIIGKIRSVV
jgi:hypothetical protein